MKTKICSKCSQSKTRDQFYKHSTRKDGLQPACKSCMKICNRHSRIKKSEHYRNVKLQREQKKRKMFTAWKAQQKCLICFETDDCCLELHHLDPREKDVTISNVVRSWSWNRLQKEIQKCTILCSNCHKKVHANKIKLELTGCGQVVWHQFRELGIASSNLVTPTIDLNGKVLDNYPL